MTTLIRRNSPFIPGIPPKHRLGASKREALALAGSVALFVLIALSFWWSATH